MTKIQLHERMDALTMEIDLASRKCEQLYDPWNEACRRLASLERERSDVFYQLLDLNK